VKQSACLQTTRVSAPCEKCGEFSNPVHLPVDNSGIYCPTCCPCTSSQKTPDLTGAARCHTVRSMSDHQPPTAS